VHMSCKSNNLLFCLFFFHIDSLVLLNLVVLFIRIKLIVYNEIVWILQLFVYNQGLILFHSIKFLMDHICILIFCQAFTFLFRCFIFIFIFVQTSIFFLIEHVNISIFLYVRHIFENNSYQTKNIKSELVN
jgi:hypothetical protein